MLAPAPRNTGPEDLACSISVVVHDLRQIANDISEEKAAIEAEAEAEAGAEAPTATETVVDWVSFLVLPSVRTPPSFRAF